MADSRYRAGPWPGLTPRGAGLLLACAAFLAVGQALVGPIRQPWPDLPVLGVTALLPMVIAVRLINAPGAAAGVCGAYLLPRTTASLLLPSLELPPLLLVPAIALEIALWLHAGDLALPARRGAWRKRKRPEQRRVTSRQAGLAGAVFGLALGIVEASYRVFLGADPGEWSGAIVWVAIGVTCAACAALGTLLTAQGRAT